VWQVGDTLSRDSEHRPSPAQPLCGLMRLASDSASEFGPTPREGSAIDLNPGLLNLEFPRSRRRPSLGLLRYEYMKSPRSGWTGKLPRVRACAGREISKKSSEEWNKTQGRTDRGPGGPHWSPSESTLSDAAGRRHP
jgi:hypothetical protein